jgi:integrase
MERMLEELGHRGQHAWDLLDRVAANTVSVAELYHAFSHNDLDGLRARLRAAETNAQAVDLADHMGPWTTWLADRVTKDTRERYMAHLRTLIPEGAPFRVSQFTAPAIAQWLNERSRLPQKRRRSSTRKSRRQPDTPPPPVSGSTKRKYLAAAQSFAKYLVQVGVLPSNIARGVEAPRQNKPKAVEIPLSDVRRIVEGSEHPYRGLFALLYGAGVEISAALACAQPDVDVKRREVRARGTKAHTRDRVVRVAEWAWPHLEQHLETLMPGERLFRDLDRKTVGDVHRARLVMLGIPHHRLHDSRHFYAIRAVRAGTPYELVARQLGHADVQMVATRYGRYAPRSDERDRWERIAAQLDEPAPATDKKLGAMGTLMGTSLQKDSSQPPVSDWLVDSRGGTRTHDPGIMSLARDPAKSGPERENRGVERHEKD